VFSLKFFFTIFISCIYVEIIWFKCTNEFMDLRINFARHNIREETKLLNGTQYNYFIKRIFVTHMGTQIFFSKPIYRIMFRLF